MEHEADLSTLYEKYFSNEITFIDITNVMPQPQAGWAYDEGVFTDITKSSALAALDAEYQPQFAELAQSLGVATLDGNQAAITGIKEDYAALKAEYQAKAKEIG